MGLYLHFGSSLSKGLMAYLVLILQIKETLKFNWHTIMQVDQPTKVKDFKFPEDHKELYEAVFGCSKQSDSLNHTSSPDFMLQLKHICTDPISEITTV